MPALALAAIAVAASLEEEQEQEQEQAHQALPLVRSSIARQSRLKVLTHLCVKEGLVPTPIRLLPLAKTSQRLGLHLQLVEASLVAVLRLAVVALVALDRVALAASVAHPPADLVLTNQLSEARQELVCLAVAALPDLGEQLPGLPQRSELVRLLELEINRIMVLGLHHSLLILRKSKILQVATHIKPFRLFPHTASFRLKSCGW
jgi:hypothetical protein